MTPPTPRAIASKVRTFVRANDVLRPGPLLLAVSGGTDSTALALVLAELAGGLGLVLHVAHFDHRTRPRDAAADAQFVADLAGRIGAPLRVGRAARATRSEDEARRLRYAFLRRAAEAVGATAIATGHTLDDQAETVLLHIVRGSGVAGAAGMRPLRDGIARPLLSLTRVETAALCRAAGITPREDPTNASLRFARNRIRLRALPELERLNPRVREALARFADAAAGADAALERASRSAAPDTSRAAPAGTDGIDVRALPEARALRQRVLESAYRTATGVTLTARHRAALVELARTANGSKRIDLPGAIAVREYHVLRFVPAGTAEEASRRAGRGPRGAEVALRRGSTVEWNGWRLSLDATGGRSAMRGFVDAAAARELQVRARRPGDRIGEHRKLQDVFVDAKVPARLRDRWPVIVRDGSVLWVPGLTDAPRAGRTPVRAEPSSDDVRALPGIFRRSAPFRQVASLSEGRRRGGKRGRP